MQISTVGLDLAKNVFQVHGIDAKGEEVVRRRLRRVKVRDFFAGMEPCLIGLEACGAAHFWARELTALGRGVRITGSRLFSIHRDVFRQFRERSTA